MKSYKLNFYNFPSEKTHVDYEIARNEIRDKYKSLDPKIGLIEFGTIPYPGISDMDTYVMFEYPNDYSKIRIPLLSNKTWEILQHNLFYFWYDLYENIQLLDPWIVKHTYNSGRNVVYKKIDKERTDYPIFSLSHAVMADLISLKSLSEKYKKYHEVNVIEALENLILFKYPIREARKFIDPNISYPVFEYEIDYVRKNFFQLENTEIKKRLTDLINCFHLNIDDLILRISNYINENHDDEIQVSEKTFNYWKHTRINFREGKSSVIYLNNILYSTISLPKSYYFLFKYILYSPKVIEKESLFYLRAELLKTIISRISISPNLKLPFSHFEYVKPTFKRKIAFLYADILMRFK